MTKKRKSPSPALPKKPAPPPPSSEQVQQWLAQCDWKDKTIYVSRQVMGGSSINGFAKATSTVQRIKKQRARQVAALQKKRAQAESIPSLPVQSPLQVQTEILNPRTVKKMKMEFQQGAAFCQNVYETIQGIMRQLDPASVPPPIQRLTSVVPKVPSTKRSSGTSVKPTTLYSNKAKLKTSTAAATTAPATAAAKSHCSGSNRQQQQQRPRLFQDLYCANNANVNLPFLHCKSTCRNMMRLENESLPRGSIICELPKSCGFVHCVPETMWRRKRPVATCGFWRE